MKIILAFVLTICLFACKEKEETPAITPGLVGTYEGVSTTPSYIFKDLLPDYKIFQENVVATITETASGSYKMDFKLTGVARISATSTPSPYNFEASFSFDFLKSGNGNIHTGLTVEGTYQSIFPQHPDVGTPRKYTAGIVKFVNNQMEGQLEVNYEGPGRQGDLAPIASFNLKKVK